jgi:formylglycine-generating enzyme required for sulfatase activity
MVLVPSGPYRHGLTEQQIKNVLAQFKARGLAIDMSSAAKVLRQEKLEERSVDAFLIDLTPVTNAQFQAFVDATGWETEAERRKAPQTWRTHAHLTDHPVVFVSHDDAIEFCKWADKRLPTADEWLKACRGSNGSVYPWGDDFDPDKCNTAESQHGWETTPVHQFPGGRSPYGCYDMVGNVEEWTSTPTEDDRRIVLGGSWCMTCQVYGLSVLRRVASRKFYSNEQGFRCARNAGA